MCPGWLARVMVMRDMRHPLRKARAWLLARLLPKGVTTAQVTQTLDAIRRERVIAGLLKRPSKPARSRLTRNPHLSRVAAAQHVDTSALPSTLCDPLFGPFVTDDGTIDRLVGLSD